MEDTEYLFELYENLPRQGPGDNTSTRKAFNYVQGLPAKPEILDIGCGKGIQTLELARISGGRVTAIDNHQPFLDSLMKSAEEENLADRIYAKNISMMEMDFAHGSFDLIWAEGSIYLMGFSTGLERCRGLLKESGYLVVTEAVYLKPGHPGELKEFWDREYPDIKNIDENIKIIKERKYRLVSHFTLPDQSWMENFYTPMKKQIIGLRKKYAENNIVQNIYRDMEKEIGIFEKFSEYFGYEFFIMQKTGI